MYLAPKESAFEPLGCPITQNAYKERQYWHTHNI